MAQASFTKADVKAIIEEKGLDNLSAKSVRVSLEERLGMEEGSLKPQKNEISAMIDTVLNELPGAEDGDDDEEEEEEEPAPAKKKAKKEPAVCAREQQHQRGSKQLCFIPCQTRLMCMVAPVLLCMPPASRSILAFAPALASPVSPPGARKPDARSERVNASEKAAR